MAGQLSITRRFPLTDLGEGWDDCYITFRPLSAQELLEVAKVDVLGMTNEEATAHITNFVKGRFVGGKVLLLDGTTQDAKGDHTDELPSDTLNNLYSRINGTNIDPKDTLEALRLVEKLRDSESNTKTS